MTASATGTLGAARDKFAGVLLIALSASAFGAMAIFARFAYAAGADVYGLLAVRFVLAAVAMGVVMLARNDPTATPGLVVVLAPITLALAALTLRLLGGYAGRADRADTVRGTPTSASLQQEVGS